jgi:hypothetical protein
MALSMVLQFVVAFSSLSHSRSPPHFLIDSALLDGNLKLYGCAPSIIVDWRLVLRKSYEENIREAAADISAGIRLQ